MLALIALGLAVVVSGWFIALSIRRPATRQIVVAPLAPAQPLPAATQDQMRSTLLPSEGMAITLKQRDSRWLAGGKLKLSIDDITAAQVLISISDDAGNVLLGPKSVREGDRLEFADPDGAPVLLEVLKLTNLLTGDDFADFRLAPAAPVTQPAASERANARF